MTTPFDVAKTRVMLAKVINLPFMQPTVVFRWLRIVYYKSFALTGCTTIGFFGDIYYCFFHVQKDCPTTKVNPFKVLILIGKDEGLKK